MKKYMSKLLIVVSILAFILNMNCSALHQNIGSIERLNYAFATSDEIESQVKALHKDIINSNGGKTLEGWCAQYVSWSLYHQGITTNFEAKGNANQVYGNWKDKSITSGGYEVIKYPGEDGLAQLIEENGNEIYNVVVGFNYSPYGEAGRKYGHVMYIYAIVDGYLYYSESGTWYNKPTGTVFKKTLSEYKDMYKGHVYDGAIYFAKDENYPNVKMDEGTYSIRTACNTEKALDVFVQSLDDKANVHLWDVGSQNSQKWNVVKNGSYYTIINVNSGKALDVENGDTASGTNVWQYKPNSTNAQKWRFEDAGNGYYYIRSACGLYLDLYGANTENGTNIAVYSNNGGSDNQKWKLVSCSPESQENGSNDGDDWGEWSAWTTTPVSATDNRQVDVGTAYVYYHYVLTDSDGSGAYPINRATMKANGFTYDSEEYHEYISMTELTRDTTGRLVYMVNGSRQVYDRFRNEHCTSEHKFIYSNYLYYKGTTTKYRYRDKNNTEHIHTYSEVKYEAEHPHNAYKICTSCGEKIYVPGGVCSTDCEECNPTVYYALYYDANGGIEPPSPQTAEDGETVRISNGEPGKNGYTFIGWSYDRGSDRADLYGGDRITLTSDRTLYAVWEKKTDDSMILTIGSTSASVFGKTMYNDVAPLLANGRTMLPARFVAENLGAEVSWNAENQCVTIRKGTRTIELYIGSDTAKMDGQTVSLDSAAFVKNSRTYCPIRFIAEALGASVEWNETEQKVIITK